MIRREGRYGVILWVFAVFLVWGIVLPATAEAAQEDAQNSTDAKVGDGTDGSSSVTEDAASPATDNWASTPAQAGESAPGAESPSQLRVSDSVSEDGAEPQGSAPQGSASPAAGSSASQSAQDEGNESGSDSSGKGASESASSAAEPASSSSAAEPASSEKDDPISTSDKTNLPQGTAASTVSASGEAAVLGQRRAPAQLSWGTVTFDKSAGSAASETVSFTSADQTLGARGLYDTGSWISKRYFIGWSDNASWSGDGSSNLYFATSTIGEVFPQGFSGNKTLYAIYVGALELGMLPKQGSIDIVSGADASRVVPDSTLKESTGFDGNGPKEASFYYDQDQEENTLVLDVNFKFNEKLALLTYLNPGGILVNSGTWSDGSKEGASYSHVDLHFTLDERVKLAEEITLSFTSSNFKPSYILDSDYQIVQSGLSDLVVAGNSTTYFTFKPGDKHEFILRTTIRRDGNAKNALTVTPEQAMMDMVLASASDSNFVVTREVARQIALGLAQPLSFTGYVDGVSKASILKSSIPQIVADPVTVGFVSDQVRFMDGQTDLGTVKVVHDSSIDGDDFDEHSMPAAPVRAGYVFAGWNTLADGSGASFTGTTVVSQDLTVFAQWRAIAQHVLVTFLDQGDFHAVTKLEKGRSIASSASTGAAMPTDPVRSDHSFLGWNTKHDGSGDSFHHHSEVHSDMTVHAMWKKDDVKPASDPDPKPQPESGADPDPSKPTDPVDPEDPGFGGGPAATFATASYAPSEAKAAPTQLAQTADSANPYLLALTAAAASSGIASIALLKRRRES